MGPLALLSAVPFESGSILSTLSNVRRAEIAAKPVYRGRLFGHDILLMNTGIGKVNAAHSATCIIENFSACMVINFGAGGAYPGCGLSIGDVAVASKEIYADEGITGLKKWKGMDEIGIPVVQKGRKRYFNEFKADDSLIRKFITDRPAAVRMIRQGAFITVSAVSGTNKRAVELEERHNAVCENMEGAAIAHICVIYNIPFFEIRGISNIAGVRDKRQWDIKTATENCQKFMLEMIGALE